MITLNLSSVKGTFEACYPSPGLIRGEAHYKICDIKVLEEQPVELIKTLGNMSGGLRIMGPKSLDGVFYSDRPIHMDTVGNIIIDDLCVLKDVRLIAMNFPGHMYEKYQYRFVAQEVNYDDMMKLEKSLTRKVDFEF